MKTISSDNHPGRKPNGRGKGYPYIGFFNRPLKLPNNKITVSNRETVAKIVAIFPPLALPRSGSNGLAKATLSPAAAGLPFCL